MELIFFTGPEEFMGWLENNHDKATELWIGLNKKSKRTVNGLDYFSAVEVALCYGWIDGKALSIDEYSYKVRFTPRRPDSVWSRINVQRVEALTAAGLMNPAGLAAFSRRNPEKSGIYSFEREQLSLTNEMEDEFRVNQTAWKYFCNSSPSYRRTCIYWVMSAKLESTKNKRLRLLIDCSSESLKIPLLRKKTGQKHP